MIELIFTSGYLKGKRYASTSKDPEAMGIGRSSENAVSIMSPHVSSRHGVVERGPEGYVYRDLGSTNGTLIRRQGHEIYLGRDTRAEAPLRDGDVLVLGAIPDLFSIRVCIRTEDAAPQDGGGTVLATCALQDIEAVDRAVREDHESLLALYRFTRRAHGIVDSGELLEHLSGSVFSLLRHATHVTVFRVEPETLAFSPWLSRRRQESPEAGPFPLSRSLVTRALDKREALLFQDAPRDIPGTESIVASGIRSSLCVPLCARERVLGLLQVDNRESSAPFQARDLELAAIMGSHAATLLGNIRLYEELKATLDRLELMELAKRHMSKFVPSTLRKIIEADPKDLRTERVERPVTVLFLDIGGYTRMNQSLSYGEVHRIVEQYFSRFMDEIHANNGDINETAGDGLMVIFQGEQHALDAVRTAVTIQRQTARINAEREAEQRPVEVNVGVNTGQASVGLVKFEGYSGARWTYTASGNTTNVAARLADHAEGGRILIGRGTADQLGDAFPMEDLGDVQFKNVRGPTRVYRVIAG